MRRVPLWATLLPLLIGIAAYALWYDGARRAFRQELAAALPGQTFVLAGFPYRLQANLGGVAVRRAAGGAFLEVRAEAAEVDRQPWRSALSVVGARALRLQVAAAGVVGARFQLEAPTARASLDRGGGALRRLSIEAPDARLWLALLPGVITASRIELHARETPTLVPTPGPRAPVQAEAVVRGQRVRLGSLGAPLTLEGAFRVTAARPLTTVDRWRAGGTVEIARLTLADAGGAVAELAATLSPGRGGRPMLAGTVTTVCPRAVVAAWNGTQPPLEHRARRPVVMAFAGEAMAVRLRLDLATLATAPARRREAPCPRLR